MHTKQNKMKKTISEFIFTKEFFNYNNKGEKTKCEMEVLIRIDYENKTYSLINKENRDRSLFSSFNFRDLSLKNGEEKTAISCLKKAVKFAKKELAKHEQNNLKEFKNLPSTKDDFSPDNTLDYERERKMIDKLISNPKEYYEDILGLTSTKDDSDSVEVPGFIA